VRDLASVRGWGLGFRLVRNHTDRELCFFVFLLSVGLPVANAPGCTSAMWLIVLP
jgi:hypothetical protein